MFNHACKSPSAQFSLCDAERSFCNEFKIRAPVTYNCIYTGCVSSFFLFNAILGSKRYLLIMSVLSGFLFGLLTEYAQLFLSYRAFSLNDLLANSVGVALGSLILITFLKVKKSGQP